MQPTSSSPALVILAAGLGSRFGGLKQLAPVGPNGEALLDYTILDAAHAGVRRVVVVTRSEIESAMREHVARFKDVYGTTLEFVFVLQDQSSAPKRHKPWGTGHALWCAAPFLQGANFAVVNADDRYGPHALSVALDGLNANEAHRLVGYPVTATLPNTGGVSRARCVVSDGGLLLSLQECTQVRFENERITSDQGDFLPETLVSLNLWGFTPKILPLLEERWQEFIEKNAHEDRAEFYLPVLVGDLIRAGLATVQVVSTTDTWVGITTREDLPSVQAAVAAWIAAGVY